MGKKKQAHLPVTRTKTSNPHPNPNPNPRAYYCAFVGWKASGRKSGSYLQFLQQISRGKPNPIRNPNLTQNPTLTFQHHRKKSMKATCRSLSMVKLELW